jgi:hypothetical protein
VIDTETQFTLKNHQLSSDNSKNNDNGSVSLIAPSESSAQQWVEVIGAVRYNLTIHPDKRPNTSQQILSRYRFDSLQTISIVHRRSRSDRIFIPKDVMLIISDYLFRF